MNWDIKKNPLLNANICNEIILGDGGVYSVYVTSLSWVNFTTYTATRFGRTTIFKKKYIHLLELTLLTDNGSVVFRILVNTMDNYSDWFD
jgi:hypothetical protein